MAIIPWHYVVRTNDFNPMKPRGSVINAVPVFHGSSWVPSEVRTFLESPDNELPRWVLVPAAQKRGIRYVMNLYWRYKNQRGGPQNTSEHATIRNVESRAVHGWHTKWSTISCAVYGIIVVNADENEFGPNYGAKFEFLIIDDRSSIRRPPSFRKILDYMNSGISTPSLTAINDQSVVVRVATEDYEIPDMTDPEPDDTLKRQLVVNDWEDTDALNSAEWTKDAVTDDEILTRIEDAEQADPDKFTPRPTRR